MFLNLNVLVKFVANEQFSQQQNRLAISTGAKRKIPFIETSGPSRPIKKRRQVQMIGKSPRNPVVRQMMKENIPVRKPVS